ncbi:MAG TPA: SDR family oxidoreductase [Byssovorax sp.]|jgi:NAD(P)-dependent dehydrogenase (short-subunit alcohol dehydrogenase family)
MKLEGQKVVVFGGGSGVGLAAARLLASHGAEVVISGRGADKLAKAAKESPGDVTGRAVDGRDVAAVKAFFAEVGAFDHLVISAGQTSRGGSFLDDLDDAKLRETFDGKFWVQVTAAHAGARHVRPGGSITFFSGGASRRAMKGMVNIAAVNGAIDAIVPTLALELAPTRVNAISPGTLRTTYWTGVPDAQLEQIFGRMANALPAGRVGTADEIANAVLFLVTTGFVTGSVLAIDGGLPHASL